MLPLSKAQQVIKYYHEVGHSGTTRTFYGIRQRYYFPNMWKLVQEFVEQCTVCQSVKKTTAKNKNFIHMSDLEVPSESYSFDLKGPFRSQTGNPFSYVLVYKELFSKYAFPYIP